MQSNLGVDVFKSSSIDPTIFVYLLCLCIIVVLFTMIYRDYLKITWLKAFLFSLFCVASAGAVFYYNVWIYESSHVKVSPQQMTQKIIPNMLLVLFAFPLIVQLIRKWTGKLTEQEKMVGPEGFKAWLTVGNLVCCVGISLCYGAMQEDGSFIAVLIALCVTIAIVLIYPFVNWIAQDRNQIDAPSSGDDMSAAQVKIIKMLEEGKISSQECGDLLTALNNPAKEPQDNESPQA